MAWMNAILLKKFVLCFMFIYAVLPETDASERHSSYTQMPSHVAWQKFLGDSTQMLYVETPWSLKTPRREPSGGVSEQCMHLLNTFTNATSIYLHCIMTNARPLHYCENCVSEFTRAINAYNAICQDMENGTTCQNELLRADDVQVILLVYDFIVSVWDKSACHNCYNATVKNDTTIYSPTEDTMEMLERIQKVQDCFHDFGDDHIDNVSVCYLCKEFYKSANEYYNALDEEGKLCSDLEDAMNYTRRMWSKEFRCTVAIHSDLMIYGMAVAIGFIPIIFYLSAFVYGKRQITATWRTAERTEEGDNEERREMNIEDRDTPETSVQT